MKKDQNLLNKNNHSNDSSGKPLQITRITLDNNHLRTQIIEDDHQIKEVHETSPKTDIVDQTVEIVNVEITIQSQFEYS